MFSYEGMKKIIAIRDDPKLLDDSGEVPKPNRVVGGSIFSREIVSLLDGKLTTRWLRASYIKNK